MDYTDKNLTEKLKCNDCMLDFKMTRRSEIHNYSSHTMVT